MLNILHVFFRFCFKKDFMSSIWYKSIIKQIPKSLQADSRFLMNYRGIGFLSTAYKVFSSVLNNRLSEYLEINSISPYREAEWLDSGNIEHVLTISMFCPR